MHKYMSACLRQRMCEESMCLNQSEGLCVCLYTRKRAVCAFATENERIYICECVSVRECVRMNTVYEGDKERERERGCARISIFVLCLSVYVYEICV